MYWWSARGRCEFHFHLVGAAEASLQLVKPSLPPGPSFFSPLSFLGHRWCVARSWKEKHPTSHVSSFILLMGQQPWAVTFRRVPRPLLPTIYVGQEASGDSIHQLPFPQVTQALRTVSPRADPHPREESSGRISLPTAPRTRGGVGWGVSCSSHHQDPPGSRSEGSRMCRPTTPGPGGP